MSSAATLAKSASFLLALSLRHGWLFSSAVQQAARKQEMQRTQSQSNGEQQKQKH